VSNLDFFALALVLGVDAAQFFPGSARWIGGAVRVLCGDTITEADADAYANYCACQRFVPDGALDAAVIARINGALQKDAVTAAEIETSVLRAARAVGKVLSRHNWKLIDGELR
jgi:hypothetical protein